MPWWETHIFGKGMVPASQNCFCPNPSSTSWPRRPPLRRGTRRASAAMGIVPNELKLKSFYTNLWWPTNLGLCLESTLFMKKMSLFSNATLPVQHILLQILVKYLSFWGHFITNVGGAEQFCIVVENSVCSWFFWDLAKMKKLCTAEANFSLLPY